MIVYEEGKTPQQQGEAHDILALLTTCYPGHPWAVRVDDGIIFIRHLAFGDGKWGMNLRTSEVDHDAAVMRKKIIMLAGEWLERAGIARTRFDSDQENYRVEGVPERHQPHQPLPEGVKIVMPDSPTELRSEARPQVMENG